MPIQNIYETKNVNRVVMSLRRDNQLPFVMRNFFGDVVMSNNSTPDSDNIIFDVESDQFAFRVAPVTYSDGRPVVMTQEGYTTKSLPALYTSVTTPLRSRNAFRRAPGQNATQSNPQQVQMANLMTAQERQLSSFDMRNEVIATSLLIDGQVNVDVFGPDGESKEQINIDIERDPELQINLTGAAQWDQAGVSPVDDINSWKILVNRKSGTRVRNVLMGLDTWNLIQKDPKYKDMVNTELAKVVANGEAKVLLDGEPVELAFVDDSGCRYWLYTQQKYDVQTSQDVDIMDDYRFVMIGGLDGAYQVGPIRDDSAGYRQVEMYSKVHWTDQTERERAVLFQANGLPFMFRQNATLSAKVKQ